MYESMFMMNRENYLETAARFIREAYNKPTITKKRLEEILEHQPILYNILSTWKMAKPGETINQGRLENSNYLYALIKECSSLLDRNYESIINYQRSLNNKFMIEVVSEFAHIIIFRDNNRNAVAVTIKKRAF